MVRARFHGESRERTGGMKMAAADGKQRLTDAATAQNLLRIVQSIPSPKAEPIPGEALARFEIPLPPLPELRRGVAKFEDLSAETKRLESIYQQKLAALDELEYHRCNKPSLARCRTPA